MIKNLFFISFLFFSFFSLSKEADIIDKIISLNLNNEPAHLIITKLTKNHNIIIFSHSNILKILEEENISNENKITIIKLLTLLDQLLEKRKQFYNMASKFNTYHILYITEYKDTELKTVNSIKETFKIIEEVDKNIISAINKIQFLYKNNN